MDTIRLKFQFKVYDFFDTDCWTIQSWAGLFFQPLFHVFWLFTASFILDSAAKFHMQQPSYGSGSHIASHANIQGNISWPFTQPEEQLRNTENQVALSLTWWIYRWHTCLCDWMHRNYTMQHDVTTSMWCHTQLNVILPHDRHTASHMKHKRQKKM